MSPVVLNDINASPLVAKAAEALKQSFQVRLLVMAVVIVIVAAGQLLRKLGLHDVFHV